MAGNLGKEDSSSVQDLQDPSITAHAYTLKHAGSGHKRRQGPVQQASSRAGKKPKRDIDRDHREKKKQEVEKFKAETEELKKGKCHLEGQAFILEKHLKETREENTKQKIELQRQSDSIHKLEKKMLERDREWNALKEELERQMQFCSSWHMDISILRTPGR
ncbi:PREDICTED: trichohyalin-like isoform X4 [Populus euphratica]|uniref:Trichohyalin-like isoform X4 n=1 Tax=Populus euphratica TaxID=75702 RepID=A0AAJ6VFK8_POPEU|nr:PREDICTED: trichohyalin-like isoform X4 [Populus euphratica]